MPLNIRALYANTRLYGETAYCVSDLQIGGSNIFIVSESIRLKNIRVFYGTGISKISSIVFTYTEIKFCPGF